MSAPIADSVPVYAARIGDAERDRDDVLAIWRDAVSQDLRLHAAKYEWFHQRCPAGAPLLALVDYLPANSCVGTLAAGRRRMLWSGQEIGAGVMADMAIAARHRTLGPVLTLQAKLLDAAADRFDWLYGFPNAKSIAVAKRAGFPVIGQLGRYSRVLRHAGYLRRIMPPAMARPVGWLFDGMLDLLRWSRAATRKRVIVTWSERVDLCMDQLWQNSAHGDGLIGIRDGAFLRWRFDECPLAATRYLCLREQPQGPLIAWFACQVEGATLHVRDFWSRYAAQGLPRWQIEALLRAARRAPGVYAAVSIEYAASDDKLAGWIAAGFTERGRRPIIGRRLDHGASRIADLHITSADEDE